MDSPYPQTSIATDMLMLFIGVTSLACVFLLTALVTTVVLADLTRQ